MNKKIDLLKDANYDSFKIDKSPILKSFRHWLQVKAIIFFANLTSKLSFHTNQKIGRTLGTFAYYLSNKKRKIALYQLGFAIPEYNEKERRRVCKGVFLNFGQTIMEIFSLDKIYADPDRYLEIHHADVMEEAIREGKGVTALTAHSGNWEVLPVVFLKHNWTAKAIARPQAKNEINKFLMNKRENRNFKLIGRGEKSTGREIVQNYKHKKTLIMLIDQDTKVQSVFVPFFGRLAKTPKSAASLAIRFNTPVIQIFNYRDQFGKIHYDFKRVAQGPYENSEAEVLRLTERFSSVLEESIRQHPDQWAWFHRRWQSQAPQSNNEI